MLRHLIKPLKLITSECVVETPEDCLVWGLWQIPKWRQAAVAAAITLPQARGLERRALHDEFSFLHQGIFLKSKLHY